MKLTSGSKKIYSNLNIRMPRKQKSSIAVVNSKASKRKRLSNNNGANCDVEKIIGELITDSLINIILINI